MGWGAAGLLTLFFLPVFLVTFLTEIQRDLTTLISDLPSIHCVIYVVCSLG